MRKLLLVIAGLISCVQSFGQTGVQLYDDTYVHEVRITSSLPNFWQTMTDNHQDVIDGIADKVYLPATISIDGTVYDTVGVRIKGFSSFFGTFGDKKSIKIDMNKFVKKQKHDGLKKFNLNNSFADPSFLRDKLAYDIFADEGVVAPRCAFANVYVNNELFGLYQLIEQVDKTFLEENFANAEGNLFKSTDFTELTWQGTNPDQYRDEFELKTNETADNWDGFINFVDIINNSDTAALDTNIRKVLNEHHYFFTFAVDRLINNWDSYMDHGRNFYIYEDSTSQEMHWIPWDYNLAFSDTDFDIIPTNLTGKPLVDAVFQVDTFRTDYLNIVCRILDGGFHEDSLFNRIDVLANLIRDDVKADTKKETGDSAFETAVTSLTNQGGGFPNFNPPPLKFFIQAKQQRFDNQLLQLGHVCSPLEITSVDDALIQQVIKDKAVLYPNPVSGNSYFLMEQRAGAFNLNVFDLAGKMVSSQQQVTQEDLFISSNNLNPGIYLFELSGEDGFLVREKFVVQ